MLPRRESIPFAFIAESDAFRSDVRPPERRRTTRGEKASGVLVGVLVVAGLVGSVVFGVPALESDEEPRRAQHSRNVGD